jgi:hypothetical protein
MADSGVALSAAADTQLRDHIRRMAGGNATIVTADTTLTADHAGVVEIAITANRTITLPAAAAANGRPIRLHFVRTDTAAATATVQRAGADTIEGGTSIPVPVAGRVTLVSDGVGTWRVIGEAAWGRSIGTNGYMRMPGGLIMQWGAVAGTSQTLTAATTVTYPMAFPSGVFFVLGMIEYAGADGLMDMAPAAGVPTLTQCRFVAGTTLPSGEGTETRTFGWRWLAYGN